MGKLSKFSLDEKERMVKFFQSDEPSFYNIYKEFEIDKYTLKKWVRRYKLLGRKGSFEEKSEAVKYCLVM